MVKTYWLAVAVTAGEANGLTCGVAEVAGGTVGETVRESAGVVSGGVDATTMMARRKVVELAGLASRTAREVTRVASRTVESSRAHWAVSRSTGVFGETVTWVSSEVVSGSAVAVCKLPFMGRNPEGWKTQRAVINPEGYTVGRTTGEKIVPLPSCSRNEPRYEKRRIISRLAKQ